MASEATKIEPSKLIVSCYDEKHSFDYRKTDGIDTVMDIGR
jgi:hypothetical protein